MTASFSNIENASEAAQLQSWSCALKLTALSIDRSFIRSSDSSYELHICSLLQATEVPLDSASTKAMQQYCEKW